MTALSQVEQDSQSAVGRDSSKKAFRAHSVSIGSNHEGLSLSRLGQNCESNSLTVATAAGDEEVQIRW